MNKYHFCDNKHAVFKSDKQLRERVCSFIGYQEDEEDGSQRLALWNCPFHEALIDGKMRQHPATFSVLDPK